jgi:hypothetical protein
LTPGRLLQGENTPDVFDVENGDADVFADDENFVDVLNDAGSLSGNGKLTRFGDENDGLDGYFWLNLPAREGFCVASNPGPNPIKLLLTNLPF